MTGVPVWDRASLEIEARLTVTDLDFFRQIMQALC
jgi:hypothetical protein